MSIQLGMFAINPQLRSNQHERTIEQHDTDIKRLWDAIGQLSERGYVGYGGELPPQSSASSMSSVSGSSSSSRQACLVGANLAETCELYWYWFGGAWTYYGRGCVSNNACHETNVDDCCNCVNEEEHEPNRDGLYEGEFCIVYVACTCVESSVSSSSGAGSSSGGSGAAGGPLPPGCVGEMQCDACTWVWSAGLADWFPAAPCLDGGCQCCGKPETAGEFNGQTAPGTCCDSAVTGTGCYFV